MLQARTQTLLQLSDVLLERLDSFDNLTTVPKALLTTRIASLLEARLAELKN